MNDKILISDIETQCSIGVPAEERQTPQRLLISLELETDFAKASAEDNLMATIDYHSVYLRVKKVCVERERKLIETLAEDIASFILAKFKVKLVSVEIKKFILPATAYVSVKIKRFPA